MHDITGTIRGGYKMGEENVFNEDVGYLKAAYEDLLTLDRMKKSVEKLQEEERVNKRSIAAMEKSIHDEIEKTIKEREEEIHRIYNKEIEVHKEKIKKIQQQREKKKNKKMNERVAEETADIREENRRLVTEIQTVFRKNHVPSFCNSKIYYSLFMTRGIIEILELFLTFVVCFFGVPAVICFIGKETFLANSKMPYFFYLLIFTICMFLFFVIYVVILNTTKVKHRDTLQEGRTVKDKIKANHKKIKAITNAVTKDKDESQYGLHEYDEQIAELNKLLDDIAKQKQEALTDFENSKKKIVIEEIKKRRNDALMILKNKQKEIEEQRSLGEQAIKEQNLIINKKYEVYLGKDYMSIPILDDLIQIMEAGDADTVSEAIAYYDGELE